MLYQAGQAERGGPALCRLRRRLPEAAPPAAALRGGALAGAAVDVFPAEPERNGAGFANGLALA